MKGCVHVCILSAWSVSNMPQRLVYTVQHSRMWLSSISMAELLNVIALTASATLEFATCQNHIYMSKTKLALPALSVYSFCNSPEQWYSAVQAAVLSQSACIWHRAAISARQQAVQQHAAQVTSRSGHGPCNSCMHTIASLSTGMLRPALARLLDACVASLKRQLRASSVPYKSTGLQKSE